jgi:hypothetical protein
MYAPAVCDAKIGSSRKSLRRLSLEVDIPYTMCKYIVQWYLRIFP